MKIICHQYPDERRLVAKVMAAGFMDGNGKLFTEKSYQALIVFLDKEGFLQNKKTLTVLPELHHDLLVLMSDDDMKWVCSMVEQLYKDISYYYEESSGKERASIMIAIY